ncbi:DUF4124 domain-containing protein [Montanilutibacter psychrotolerans]|uniref:DUF4124 domain-containing protein n=1 Tax=Montanilutibacter psychrotolerans TaxID=1327343 RepID=A0A3M8SYJ1_9GAMM|nr:DUF4124 domain-containing protein [Lysobacter psychrotolerans]RNF84506.1 DUF4124 domain-containing protein [Lysobacter psychrotolerans]
MKLHRATYLLLALCAASAAHAGEVTIYRCTDAQNRLTLRDTPCAKGERQQVRAMVRPVDAPARPRPAPVAPQAPATLAPHVVYLQPPRTMYECTGADGQTYTSDNGDGSPRWVPSWTYGYPVYAGLDRHDTGRARIVYRDRHVRAGIDLGGPRHRPLLPAGVVHSTGSWVRDACHPLPQQEVCARLRDRRYELIRAYNSALQSERARMDNEQRGIDARLDNDCGGT